MNVQTLILVCIHGLHDCSDVAQVLRTDGCFPDLAK